MGKRCYCRGHGGVVGKDSKEALIKTSRISFVFVTAHIYYCHLASKACSLEKGTAVIVAA